jgi:Epoxide hydrolase N terminus
MPGRKPSTTYGDPLDPPRRLLLKAGLSAAAATTLGGGFDPALGSPPELPHSDGSGDYKVVWTDQQLESLRVKIKAFRFPRSIPGSGWKYGMDPEYLRELITYWANGFDMEGAARNLNRYPQYVTRVEDLDIQFISVIGEGGPNKARLQLLSTHGWPGSTFEFWNVIEPLAFPSRFGASSDVAFDLIIPSLPGHGASGKPVRPIGARTTARLWDKLKAIHLNLMIVAPQVPAEAEKIFYVDAEEDEKLWGAYYQLQATEPQSLAYATVDNPVAQAEWLIQRFYQWSDKRTRSFDQVFSMDQLLTNVMIYVMNDTFQTSTWFYTGSQEEHVKQMPYGARVRVPTGFASYSGDARSPTPPRSIVEKGYNLQYWADVPHGGHFAAMEVPESLC